MKVIVCPKCGAVKEYRLTRTIKTQMRFDAEDRPLGDTGKSKESMTTRKLCACGRLVRIIDIDVEMVNE